MKWWLDYEPTLFHGSTWHVPQRMHPGGANRIEHIAHIGCIITRPQGMHLGEAHRKKHLSQMMRIITSK